jgi:hypothetical protein
MTNLPQYLILSDKVYEITVSRATGGRAFDRDLIDYVVKGINPLSASDKWTTRLGMSSELEEDFPSFKENVSLDWILFRFLMPFCLYKFYSYSFR